MDLDEAFRHALDGDAILFLGAGFSLGAQNRLSADFPLANDLSKHLMEALGERETTSLQIASELYSKKRGDVGLLRFLNDNLGVLQVAPHHKLFARPKWRRIYTTNYDEVMEAAAREERKALRSLILTSDVPAFAPGQIDCIHINGFLPWANVQNLHSTLILSETAYLTNRFATSPWASLFRNDLETARAAIFAGYSLADLDINRILLAVERVRAKCVFIVGPNPSLSLRTTIEKFGSLSEMSGVAAAAETLRSIEKTHRPAPRQIHFSSFLPVRASASPTPPSAKDVFDLFVKGESDVGHIIRSLSEETPTYVVNRAELDDVDGAFARGAPAIVLLSRLGNGKTTLGECVAAKLQDRFEVFIFTKETLSLPDELGALRAPARPTLLVVDDYTKHLDLIRSLRLGAGANQHLLLTSRTPTHLAFREQLLGALGGAGPLEFRVDALRESELKGLDSILAGAGLLGHAAGWSQARRIQELYRLKGAGEFGGILLWLLDSPAIRSKLEELFVGLRAAGHAQDVVIAAMALTHIGQPPDIDDIADMVGVDIVNQAIFSENAVIADLVRFERRIAYPRSSLFATAALRALWQSANVPRVLEQMLRAAWQKRASIRRFRIMARDLMRYSLLRRIAPTEDPSRHVQSYYERIRNMPSCVNNELFWLQFSLADIERKQFDLAERHLTQAYSIAARMKGYDTYQIDNVKALFLLRREIEERNRDRALRSFVDASTILGRQMRDRRHAYYPFRVARLYGEFWQAIASQWSAEHKSIFFAACRSALQFAQKVDPDLAEMDDIIHFRRVMDMILAEVASGSAS